MRIVRALASVALIGGCFVALTGTPASAVAPKVIVSPSTGLVHGESVVVRLRGLPPHTSVGLAECDTFFILFEDPVCSRVGALTTNGNGRGAAGVVLDDPVVNASPGADSHFVYCRDEQCRMWAWWTDSAGDIQTAASAVLDFVGSTLTYSASPTDRLVNGERVKLSGTAYGAEGQTMQVVEVFCVDDVQLTCTAVQVLGSAVVRPNGTWSRAVHVHRRIGGEDCANPDSLAYCGVAAEVVETSGAVDLSFGAVLTGDTVSRLSFTSN
ncbi:MAG: hypothetical protein ACJ735_01825 [Actinomycetes bacterium]